MHAPFVFVPPENRAPPPLWVKLGSGETVLARDAYAGAAPPEAVARHVLREFCRAFVSKAFAGGVEAWKGMFLNAPEAVSFTPKNYMRYTRETAFGVTPGAYDPKLEINPNRLRHQTHFEPIKNAVAKDWPGPLALYMCNCAVCRDIYMGPKRSHLCWEHYEGPEKALPAGR